MKPKAHCAQCGAPLPADVAEGICPQCELRGALNLNDEPTHSVSDPGGAQTEARIGDYELLEEIARGGMGVVFKARQRSLNRLVALKLLPAGTLAKPEAVKRFQAEASAAAALQHPNIVAIHEIGVQGDQHFIAMDLVDGPSLSRVVAAGPLPPRRAADYMKAIAEAIHYAHERGILHRDLKPSNVLLGANDQPRVTDFGLAKRIGGSRDESRESRAGDAAAGSGSRLSAFDSRLDLTVSGQLLGSPNYMPPEQAAAHRGKVSRRSDVYGLGATLYHLLTGRAPFQGASITEVLQQVANADPLAPRLLQPGVPADLETICLKCLEKEPAKRYPTAQAFADELVRFLRDEPIHAHPVSSIEKAWRWCRRKPALAGLWASIFLLLVAVFTGIALAGLRNAATRRAEQREYFAGITSADNYVRIGDIQRALDILTNCPPRLRHWEWGRLMYLCHQEIATIHTVTNLKMAIIANLEYTRIIVNTDRSRLVTVGEDGVATAWSLKTGAKLFLVGGSTNRVIDMAFNVDGRKLALLGNAGVVEVWDVSEARRLFALTASNGPVQTVSFSLDSAQIRITTADSATTCDAQTGQHVATTPALPGKFLRMALARSGARIATLDAKGKVHLWDATTGRLQRTLDGSFSPNARLFISPNGHRLVAANSAAGASSVWNTDTGEQLCDIPSGADLVVFNADGTRIAVLGANNVLRVWSADSGREILALKGHSAIVRFIAWSADDRQITTASEDAVVKVWKADFGRELIATGELTDGLSFSPDGKRLAVAQEDNQARVWDVESGRQALTLRGHLHRVVRIAFSPDGRRLATASSDKTAMVWDAGTGLKEHTLRGHHRRLYSVAFSPDGKRIATGSADKTAKIWDTETGREIRTLVGHTQSVFWVAYSPDGKRLATTGRDQTVILWNPETGERIHTLRGHAERVLSLAFSPDGRLLASAGFDRMIHLWDPVSGKKLRSLPGHLKLYSVTFSPDGKRLAASSAEHSRTDVQPSAQLWDVETGRELIALSGHAAPVSTLAFSPDGKRLATADWDGFVRIRETFPWREKEYPGPDSQPLVERVNQFAQNYWMRRLAIDTSALTARSDPSPPPSIDRAEFPSRASDTPARLIDLTDYYNGLLTVSWVPNRFLQYLESDLAALPKGKVSFAGIPFDVRGAIQLAAPPNPAFDNPSLPLPERVSGVRINQKLRRLQTLHGAIGSVADGTTICSFILHYAGGGTEDLEIVYGKHVRDWWNGEDSKAAVSKGSVVWEGSNSVTELLGGKIRLYASTFDNPRPEVEVVSLDFVSKLTRSGPFIIALTADPEP